MTSLTPEQQIYADLMDEAKVRIHAVRDAIGEREKWVPRLLQEFAYLQLRMLCETIAVGCLVAHGDIKHRKTLGSWKLRDIMGKLEELNPEFYPREVGFRNVGGVVQLDEYNVPQLSKSELIQLWDRAGSVLHRGSAKNLLSQKGKMLNVDLDVIIQYGQKIQHLLEQHVISSADKKKHLLVALASADAGGNAAVWVALSP
jgi:hypothetical protein